jgi:hypothetical protein
MSADGTPAPKRRKMPAQKPGTSEQEVVTPRDFIEACEFRFGRFDFDLCASKANAVVPDAYFDKTRDAFRFDWSELEGNNWCNPEFGEIPRWLEKAAAEATPLARVFVLTPLSVDANWWWKFIRPFSISYALHPRLKFVGHKHLFPKGLALSIFGWGATGFGRFRWKDELAKKHAARAKDCGPPLDAAGMIEVPEGADMKSELVNRGLVPPDAWEGRSEG